jgi:hypothetical protein
VLDGEQQAIHCQVAAVGGQPELLERDDVVDAVLGNPLDRAGDGVPLATAAGNWMPSSRSRRASSSHRPGSITAGMPAAAQAFAWKLTITGRLLQTITEVAAARR